MFSRGPRKRQVLMHPNATTTSDISQWRSAVVAECSRRGCLKQLLTERTETNKSKGPWPFRSELEGERVFFYGSIELWQCQWDDGNPWK